MANRPFATRLLTRSLPGVYAAPGSPSRSTAWPTPAYPQTHPGRYVDYYSRVLSVARFRTPRGARAAAGGGVLGWGKRVLIFDVCRLSVCVSRLARRRAAAGSAKPNGAITSHPWQYNSILLNIYGVNSRPPTPQSSGGSLRCFAASPAPTWGWHWEGWALG